ncbi:uncharacterized protein METZ01_LOCUS474758, partial [marine metagenome]
MKNMKFLIRFCMIFPIAISLSIMQNKPKN